MIEQAIKIYDPYVISYGISNDGIVDYVSSDNSVTPPTLEQVVNILNTLNPDANWVDVYNFNYTPTYAQRRANDYKPISEQLDMLYWDNVDGTTLWKDHIASVKALHPKPMFTGWWHTNDLTDMANGQGTHQITDVVGDSSNTSYPVGSSTSIDRFTFNAVKGETESSFVLNLDTAKPIDFVSFTFNNETNTSNPTIAWYAVDEDGNETLLREIVGCVDGEDYVLTNHLHIRSAKYKFKATGLDAGKPVRLVDGVIGVCQDDFEQNPFS